MNIADHRLDCQPALGEVVRSHRAQDKERAGHDTLVTFPLTALLTGAPWGASTFPKVARPATDQKLTVPAKPHNEIPDYCLRPTGRLHSGSKLGENRRGRTRSRHHASP